ncbi:MAG: hypothetical protein WA947_09150 [Phormidesmis sp.]
MGRFKAPTADKKVLAAQLHEALLRQVEGNGRTGRLLMNLLLLRAGYPTVTISNQQRLAYIEALVQAQQTEDDLGALLTLVCKAASDALVETLSVVASAADSQGKGLPFYQDILAFLAAQSSE